MTRGFQREPGSGYWTLRRPPELWCIQDNHGIPPASQQVKLRRLVGPHMNVGALSDSLAAFTPESQEQDLRDR